MTNTITPADISSLLIENTEKVFSVMLGMAVSAGDAVQHPNIESADGNVVSLIGFVGEWIGTGSVCCNSEMACRISSRMLMAEYAAVNEEVLDAVGEITNMIIGNFKDAAEQLLGPLGLSTPTVIYGRNVRARNLNGQLWTTVPFDCEGGLVEVKISLGPRHSANGSAKTGILVAES
ncbi:MAG TPA: chemotaxis protein CheX [Bryobacteraceae bacterium]|nr:chemotaxis protein CheX [Bryobacteraceae bacterium]